MYRKSLSIVARFIKVKGNSIPSGCREQTCYSSNFFEILITLHIFSWFGGMSSLFYKLYNLLSIFSGLDLGPLPNQTLSWTFQCSWPYSNLSFSHNFFSYTLPLYVTIWFLLRMCLPSPASSWFLLGICLEKDFPLLFYASPSVIPAIRQLFPKEAGEWLLPAVLGLLRD